jgi:hypothetical protein
MSSDGGSTECGKVHCMIHSQINNEYAELMKIFRWFILAIDTTLITQDNR